MITGVKKLKISDNVERQNAPRILVQEVDGQVGYVPKNSIVSSGIGGTQYSYVAGKGTPTENATELQAAYTAAKADIGLSGAYRYKIIVGPGKYEFTGAFLIDTQYIDIVSLTGDADVEFWRCGISVIANDVYLKGLKTSLSFSLAGNLNLLVCENCTGGDRSFGFFGSASGTFLNCVAGNESFGFAGSASGTFINCVAGGSSFGYEGSASGTFLNCVAGNYSFGSFGSASGTFTNCVAGGSSFGYGGSASGTFTNCVAGIDSYSGIYSHMGTGGVLTGKLFYCRLTSGTFQTVSSGGRTYYCIDGNGNTNNQ